MKTRRQKQRQRSHRKQKKSRKQSQKGGAQIFAKFGSSGKYFALNVLKENTPRTMLGKLLDHNTQLQQNSELRNLRKERPPYRIQRSSKIENLSEENWNKKNYFTDSASYTFSPILKRLNTVRRRNEIEAAMTLKIIKNVLENKMFKGAKIITESSATTDNIEKNVNQQFKFKKSPVSPIILIDFAFFHPEQKNYEFYKYLKFQEIIIPEIGPPSHVRFYKKPKGDTLEINPNEQEEPVISEDEKKAYLQEVIKQAGSNLTGDELVICCIKHDMEFKIDPYIKEGQKVYVWSA
jgi:hypothetical protein